MESQLLPRAAVALPEPRALELDASLNDGDHCRIGAITRGVQRAETNQLDARRQAPEGLGVLGTGGRLTVATGDASEQRAMADSSLTRFAFFHN